MKIPRPAATPMVAVTVIAIANMWRVRTIFFSACSATFQGWARANPARSLHASPVILAYAQPPRLAPTQCDVVTLVEHVVEVEQVFAQERGVELRLTAPAARVHARVDGEKIRQLVKNLVRNALEAAPRGGHVTVGVNAEQGVVHIHVTDDGPGITDAVRARMFEPFYSTKDSGTGLGMSIVQSIVTMHGGTISITTGTAGTALDVSLPRASA